MEREKALAAAAAKRRGSTRRMSVKRGSVSVPGPGHAAASQATTTLPPWRAQRDAMRDAIERPWRLKPPPRSSSGGSLLAMGFTAPRPPWRPSGFGEYPLVGPHLPHARASTLG